MGGKLGKQHTYVVSGACGADTRHVVEPKKMIGGVTNKDGKVISAKVKLENIRRLR